MLFYIRQNRGAGAIDIAPGGPPTGRPPARASPPSPPHAPAIDIAPGGPPTGRPPARARKRPAHPSSRPGKDREQVCCVAWRPPCAAADGATSTADGATSTKVDARRHARTARFQSLALQRHARAARFPIADLSPRRTGRRPRRWTPGGTPARRDFNR